MKQGLRQAGLLIAALLGTTAVGRAQNDPHVGYVYPAGIQQGASCEVIVGGQFLRGVTAARVSGQGIQAEVLGYYRPLTNQERGVLAAELRRLQRARQGQDRRDPGGGEEAEPPKLPPILGVEDLETLTIEEIAALRQRIFDPRKQPNAQIAETVTLRLTAAPDAEPGQRELRLLTAAGATNPVRFRVGTLPEVLEGEPNDRDPDAGTLPALPVVVNGQILPGDVDRFRFRARRGQRLVIAASARELVPYLADAVPGWFQATLAVFSADGAELAYSDDYQFHPDPVLCYEFPEEGEFLLEIKDSIYRGREDFVYRITVGELPFVTSVFPLGTSAGRRTAVELRGWNLPTDWVVVPPLLGEPGLRPVSLSEGDWISNSVPFSLDVLPERFEEEPNDALSTAQRLSLPLIVNGRIERPGDQDVFLFSGGAGEEIQVEVIARRLGSPLDSFLRLTDRRGWPLATSDDSEDPEDGLATHHADSRFTITLPARDIYYLHLTDTRRHGSPAHGYRLRVGPPRPDFALRVVPSSLHVPAGGTAAFTVHVFRKGGFDGEIRMVLKDALPGFALGGGRIPAGQGRARMTLTAPGTTLDAPVALALEGQALIGGRQVRRPGVPAEDVMQAFLYRHLVPAEELLVTVPRGGLARVPLRLASAMPVRLAPGGSVEVQVRAAAGPAPAGLQLELSQPPPGITLGELTRSQDGAAFILHADPEKVEPGLEGNLIVDVSVTRRRPPRDGSQELRTRRVQAGCLPAIPFLIVEPEHARE